jgi:hypothetical protein
MTTNPLRVARGTTAALAARALKTGELAQNTDTERPHIGDGSTVGGLPVALLSDVTGLETDGDTIEVTATGSTAERTLAARFGDMLSVKDFGAQGDGRIYKGVNVTSGVFTLVCAGATFTAADVGKTIWIEYAAGGSAPLRTQITGFTNATTVTLFAAPGTTFSSAAAIVKIGTDDTTAIDAAIAALNARGQSLYFPHGTYLYSGTSGLILGDGDASAPSTSQNMELIGEIGSTFDLLAGTIEQGTAIEYFSASVATRMLYVKVARIRLENLVFNATRRVQTIWDLKHTFWSRIETCGVLFPQAGGIGAKFGAHYDAADIFIGAGGNVAHQLYISTTGALSCVALQVGEDAFNNGLDVATSRFDNCFFGVSDDTNATSWTSFNRVPTATTSTCVLLRFTDNISFDGCFTYVSGERRGNGILVKPPSGSGNAFRFPQSVRLSGCHHVGGVWVDNTDNTWDPDGGDGIERGVFVVCGHFGDAADPSYDGACNPPDIFGIDGFTDAGQEFGQFKYRKTDAASRREVISATTTAQPGSPTAEDTYIIPSGKTGASWSTFANGSIAQYRGGRWVEIVPSEGFEAYVKDTDITQSWTGSAWVTTLAGQLASAAAITGGSVTGITDLAIADGGTGASTNRAAALNLSVPYVLAQSYAAVSHTGSTAEVALATISIPAGAMGANGSIEVDTVFSYTNNANLKTLRVRFGGVSGTEYLVNNVTTTVSARDSRLIANRNSASSQVGGYSVGILSGGWGGNGNAAITSAVNTANAVDLVISGQLASAGDTVTLEGYTVTLRARA